MEVLIGTHARPVVGEQLPAVLVSPDRKPCGEQTSCPFLRPLQDTANFRAKMFVYLLFLFFSFFFGHSCHSTLVLLAHLFPPIVWICRYLGRCRYDIWDISEATCSMISLFRAKALFERCWAEGKPKLVCAEGFGGLLQVDDFLSTTEPISALFDIETVL
ncbi:hypothetical protein F5887DRAFT_664499 [Amanita rubescens]|nr:hypothetical protein F5887DRAFT_664499 [Amanita rubescens]